MRVTATTAAPAATGADTLVAGVFADEDVAHDVGDGALGAASEASGPPLRPGLVVRGASGWYTPRTC